MIQQILTEISGRLSALGIPAQYGNGADITINTEFLDAGWSTGNKKIRYEAAIFANGQDKTVYMYEKTTQTGQGLSFGNDSESSFQSGKTLFRKVKSVQYGPDGKTYEYTLDLGAIPKAVKETAKLHGWKFKTVINKNKAMYPVGYVPAFVLSAGQVKTDGQYIVGQTVKQSGVYCSNCGTRLSVGAVFCNKCGKPVHPQPQSQPQSQPQFQPQPQPQQSYVPVQPKYGSPQYGNPQYGNPQGTFYAGASKKSGGKGGVLGLIGFLILGLLLIVMLLVGRATLVGWIISLAIFLIAFFIQRKLSKKGCLLHLILWIITGFILLVVMTMVTTEDISITTAGVKNAQMTTAMGANGKPVDKVRSYSPNAPELFAAAELRNAPPNTKVKFSWSYITGDVFITEYVMDSGDSGENVYVYSSLTNDKPWPEGEYKVEIYVEDRKTPDANVEFTIASDIANVNASSASSQSIAMLLPYEKSFQLNDGKSTGKFKVFISDGTGLYESSKGRAVCEFYVKFDTSSLPADFKMKPEQATENDAMGNPALDGLIMAVCSDTQALHKSSLSSGEYIYNNNNIRPFSETEGATVTEIDSVGSNIKDIAANYPKMQVLRYNVNEVGMTQEGDGWLTHAEKAFGLHPPITEGNIPWEEILSDLGLD